MASVYKSSQSSTYKKIGMVIRDFLLGFNIQLHHAHFFCYLVLFMWPFNLSVWSDVENFETDMSLDL